jgi:hypothetical protein
VKTGPRKSSPLLTRMLAASAAIWAAAWLLVVMTPTGVVPVFDHAYEVVITFFERSGGGDFLVQRIVEFLCLVPAAALLAAAQANRQRRHGGDRLESP